MSYRMHLHIKAKLRKELKTNNSYELFVYQMSCNGLMHNCLIAVK